ncbi:unnamed protein product, partial [Ixodes pacificus]
MRHRGRRLPSNTTLRPGKWRLAPLARLDSTLVFGVLHFAGAIPKPGRRRDERTSRIPTRLWHRWASVASLLVGDDLRRTFSSAENLAHDVASMRHRCSDAGRSDTREGGRHRAKHHSAAGQHW